MEKEIIEKANFRLIVFESAKELGEKVDKCLVSMYGENPNKKTFIANIKENFFEDGHLKVEISDTVRGKDIFFLTDIGNYSITYNMHGFKNHASPNDLITQLKDGIGASNRHAKSINIVMPLLYAGRQHRRNTRENLMCGMMLHEIDGFHGIKTFVTFDAHDQGVEHALVNTEFENVYATNNIIRKMINDFSQKDLEKLLFIAPDNGATGRRNVYLNSFNNPLITRKAGSFIKQRDYNNIVDGKNPIISHDYSGNDDIKGYTAIIVDDMISSGGSMFDVIDELNKKEVGKIFIAVSYSLFTKGADKFEQYYKEGKFSGIYTTNLSYIPKEYEKYKWLHICDCSDLVSSIIYKLANEESISEILADKSEPMKLIEEKLNKKM